MKLFGIDFSPKKPEIADNIEFKKPSFSVTQFVANNPFTTLIEPEVNYFEQYILYTYKAIDFISNKIASAPIHLYSEKSIEKRKEIDSDPIFQDLEAFNPYMNLWEARKLKEMHLYLTGACYWYIDREPQINKYAEFYPLEPTKIRLKTDESGLPSYYLYTDSNGKVVGLPMEDVIYFRRVNPKNWFEGLSHTKTTAFWLNAYAQGAQYNMNKLGNNTNVDKFLFFDGISDDEKAKVEEKLKNKYQGVKNAGRTGVVNAKPEVIEVSSNQKDLDYVNGMKLLREDILASFGIPEALLFPSATNANSEEARRQFQGDTLEPLLQQEKAVLNEQLMTRYRVTTATKLYYFDFDQVIDEDRTALINEANTLFVSGIYTRDQALEYIGDKAIGGELGAEYHTVPIRQTNDVSTNPDANLPTQSDVVKTALFERVENIVKEHDRAEWRIKQIKLAEDQEGIMHASAMNLFEEQLRNTVEYLDKKEPTVRGIFNFKDNVALTKDIFKTAYSKIIANSNDVGNVEIKQALFDKASINLTNFKVKSLSGQAIEQIAQKLNYFAEVLSETTRDKLREIVVNGVNEGFDKSLFMQSVYNLFNGFADGQTNIDTLTAKSFYIEAFKMEGTKITLTDPQRYKQMFGNIFNAWGNGELTLAERNELLLALRGLIDPSSSVGRDIDKLLSDEGIPVNKGVTKSRAVTIARTEATYARNLGFQDTYNDNPFVNKKTWNSLHDRFVRESHGQLDGTSVDIDKPFQGIDGKMMFPGDTSLGAAPDEIINCRCRITAEVV